MTRNELKNEIVMILTMMDEEQSAAQVTYNIMCQVDKYDNRRKHMGPLQESNEARSLYPRKKACEWKDEDIEAWAYFCADAMLKEREREEEQTHNQVVEDIHKDVARRRREEPKKWKAYQEGYQEGYEDGKAECQSHVERGEG